MQERELQTYLAEEAEFYAQGSDEVTSYAPTPCRYSLPLVSLQVVLVQDRISYASRNGQREGANNENETVGVVGSEKALIRFSFASSTSHVTSIHINVYTP